MNILYVKLIWWRSKFYFCAATIIDVNCDLPTYNFKYNKALKLSFIKINHICGIAGIRLVFKEFRVKSSG